MNVTVKCITFIMTVATLWPYYILLSEFLFDYYSAALWALWVHVCIRYVCTQELQVWWRVRLWTTGPIWWTKLSKYIILLHFV